MATMLTLTTAAGDAISAYLAQPTGKPRGGVIILQEIFGLNSHIRGVAERYAEHGWLAVAPALFDRLQPATELDYNTQAVAEGLALKNRADAAALVDIAAAVPVAAAAGRVAVIGYCWGGSLAWRCAAGLPDNSDLSAAICYYGGDLPRLAKLQPQCPVMAHFGEFDASIPLDDVAAFRTAQPAVQCHLYPADHGFNCEQRGQYQEQSAEIAMERSLGFLAQHLEDQPA